MKLWIIIGLAVSVLGAGFMAGCLDEVVDPDLEYEVLEIYTNQTSPAPVSDSAESGQHFLYVKVSVENLNEENDLTIGPGTFTVDDNNSTVEEGEYLANDQKRDIDTIRVDPEETKTFWVIFEVEDGIVMEYIRYEGTLDEPKELELPEY